MKDFLKDLNEEKTCWKFQIFTQMAEILINPEFVLIIISSFTIILLIIIAFCLIKKKKFACSNGSLEKLIKNDDQKGEFAAPKSRSYYDQFLSKDEVDHFKVSFKHIICNIC